MMIMEHPTRVLNVFTPMQGAARRQPEVVSRDGANSISAYLLHDFAPINLRQMEGVALQDRVDTKYVFHVSRLEYVLGLLRADYAVLDIDGVRQHRYRTLYFDTADFTLYRQHHADGRNRFKVRSRCYLDTGLACLEIKHKAHADRTIKQRLHTPALVTGLTSETSAFLRAHLPTNLPALRPQLWNSFSRITLVGTGHSERVTLDVGLQFSGNDDTVVLPGVVVAEVKQARHGQMSPVMRVMRDAHIRSMGFSKYCIGASLLYPDIKYNNFKLHLRLIQKLVRGGSCDIC